MVSSECANLELEQILHVALTVVGQPGFFAVPGEVDLCLLLLETEAGARIAAAHAAAQEDAILEGELEAGRDSAQCGHLRGVAHVAVLTDHVDEARSAQLVD